jgi:phosphoglucosamine mutase
MGKLFGTDGIRGQANCYPITPEEILKLGKALAARYRDTGPDRMRALIGKDTRLSGYMLETALTSGLVSMGMDVFLVGPVPTPAVAHLARSMGCALGIMLTASHNPYDDNGIKIFARDGFKLHDGLEAAIEADLLSDRISSEHVRSDQLGKAFRMEDARGRYIEFAKSTIDNHSLRGLRVVVDCANGASYHVAPLILRELGAHVVKIHADPDGYNINNRCGALHPDTVGRAVRKHGADVGIALDGDADRVVFCDQNGRLVDGDRILAICALDMKTNGKLQQDTLVVTTMSNYGLHEAMRRNGVRVDVTDVGDRNVIERLRAGGFNLGGEKCGHLIFSDHVTTGDGIISAIQVLRLMSQRGASIAELAACMEEYPQRLVSVPVRAKKPLESLARVQAELAAGEAALSGSGRILLRYSGTEHKIRLLVEARDEQQVRDWAERLSAAVKEDLG